jgi:hypothetical protein
MRCWDSFTGKNTMTNFPNTRNSFRNSMQLGISTNGLLVYHPNVNDINVYHIHTGREIAMVE